MRSPSTQIIKHLEVLATSSGSRWQIFDDFVELCYHTLRMLPRHAESVFSGGGLVVDDDEAAAVFARVYERYGAAEAQTQFARAFSLVIQSERYHDPFGTVFEEWELTSDDAGQFFTPEELCRLMARSVAEDVGDRVRERLTTSLGVHHPELLAMKVMQIPATDATLEMLLVDSLTAGSSLDYEPVTLYDGACGSSRTLLACAELLPDWMIRRNLVAFYGQDIDRTCVHMSRANFALYGINGTGFWLTSERSEVEIVPEILEEFNGQLVLL